MLGYLCFAQTLLCSKNKDKKSESNSQHPKLEDIDVDGCVRRTKIKNLKAIHNIITMLKSSFNCCVRRTKIKNLKAIHNWGEKDLYPEYVVFEEQR